MSDTDVSSPFEHVVILGAGGMGSVFGALLATCGAQIVFVDIRPESQFKAMREPWRRLVHDATLRPEGDVREVLMGANLVILSLPHTVIQRALTNVVDTVSPETLIVDTSSVMQHLDALWNSDTAARGPRVVGLNPMFGPLIDVRGRSVLLVDPRGPNNTDPLWQLLETWGLEVIPVENAERHDRLCSVLQTAVHAAILAIGFTLAESPFSPQELLAAAPPPCRVMLLLLSRLGSQPPEVYSDIQSVNPYASEVRTSLSAAIEALNTATSESVAEIVHDLQEWLGAWAAPLRVDCGRMFDTDIFQIPHRGHPEKAIPETL
jgi:prephenate dehydrogenase